MKTLSVLSVLGAFLMINPAHAQRGGGETRGGGGETRGSTSYETRGSSSSSSGSSSSGSDYSSSSSSSSSSCCDSYSSYSGGDYSYSGGGSSRQRAKKIKLKDFSVGDRVMLVETGGDPGVITYIRKTLFGGWACIEFDEDHTEECGYKADQLKKI